MPNTDLNQPLTVPPKPVRPEELKDDLERHLIDAWRRDNEEADQAESDD